jgi:hypothetical protein
MMISVAAVSKARNWCAVEHADFGLIERRCIRYLRLTATVIGPFPNQSTMDSAFLSLVRAELEKSEAHDDAFRRHHTVWAAA